MKVAASVRVPCFWFRQVPAEGVEATFIPLEKSGWGRGCPLPRADYFTTPMASASGLTTLRP